MHLRGIREERKAVITISDGWRLFRPNTALANVGEDRRPPMPVVGVGPSGRLTNDVAGARYNDPRSKCEMDRVMLANIDNESDFRALLSRANRSNVTFYPVDSRGLPVFDTSIAGAPGAPFGSSGVPSPVVDQSRLRQRTDSLQILAAETDGIAVVNSNDIERGLSRIVADVASYYLLGYYSSNQKLDGRFRAIKVRVKRPGVDVRARRGYMAATEAEMAANAPAAALEVSAEAVALERAIGTLAGLRPDMRVRTQVAWLATPGSDGPKGRLWAIAELDRMLARGPEWTAGAKVDATLTTGEGAKLGAAAIELAAGQRGVSIDMPDVALAAWRRSCCGCGLCPLAEASPWSRACGSPSRRWPRRSGRRASGVEGRRRGRSSSAPAMRPSGATSGCASRCRWPAPPTASKPSCSIAPASALKVPVATAKLSPGAGGGDVSWAVAEVSLAPLAAADYAIRVKVALAGATHETLLAFRIIP